MSIDLQSYSQLLVCPACRTKLVVDGHSFVCRSESCRRRYEVKDDIPVMLSDEALPTAIDEWTAIIRKATPVNS
jgi:uncharacterized protein YbaR (Trm112 family)